VSAYRGGVAADADGVPNVGPLSAKRERGAAGAPFPTAKDL